MIWENIKHNFGNSVKIYIRQCITNSNDAISFSTFGSEYVEQENIIKYILIGMSMINYLKYSKLYSNEKLIYLMDKIYIHITSYKVKYLTEYLYRSWLYNRNPEKLSWITYNYISITKCNDKWIEKEQLKYHLCI